MKLVNNVVLSGAKIAFAGVENGSPSTNHLLSCTICTIVARLSPVFFTVQLEKPMVMPPLHVTREKSSSKTSFQLEIKLKKVQRHG